MHGYNCALDAKRLCQKETIFINKTPRRWAQYRRRKWQTVFSRIHFQSCIFPSNVMVFASFFVVSTLCEMIYLIIRGYPCISPLVLRWRLTRGGGYRIGANTPNIFACGAKWRLTRRGGRCTDIPWCKFRGVACPKSRENELWKNRFPNLGDLTKQATENGAVVCGIILGFVSDCWAWSWNLNGIM